MKHSIPVFRAEVDAGVAEAVRASASVAYHVPVEAVEPDAGLSARIQAAMASRADRAEASADDADLFYIRDLLVSTGWNRNDDVFDRVEVWAARHTSEDKPLNFEHDRTQVIGHIVRSEAVGEDLAPLDDATAADDLPEKFHIVNGTVIYRLLTPKNEAEEARAGLIDRTIDEIRAGEWFVSMECYLRGFDYAVVGPDGTQHVVARTEETAFLTKYLRAYPPEDSVVAALNPYLGSGKYLDRATGEEYRVGRIPRSVTFSGKGLVRRPANPESVIFASATAAFRPSANPPVYLDASREAAPVELKTDDDMTEPNAEVAAIQAKLDAALERAEAREAELATLKSKDVEAKVAGLEAAAAAKDADLVAVRAELDAVKEAVATLETRAVAAEAARDEAVAELGTLKAEAVAAARKATLIGRGADEAKAAELVDRLSPLSDEQFAATVEVIAASLKPAPAPAPAPVARVDEARAVEEATPEADVAMAADETAEAAEARAAEIAGFFEQSLFPTS